MAWAKVTGECPHCKEEIELEANRWGEDAVCPKCNGSIYINYDEDWENDHEWWWISKEIQ